MSARLPPDAFEHYVSSRSYQLVADEYGVTKRAVTKHAQREKWQERLARVDAQAKERSDKRAVETLEGMNDRHLKSLRVIQAKAIEALRTHPLATAMEAVRALDLSIKQERVIRGEPGDRTALSVEEAIRAEYSRWLVDEEVHDGVEDQQDETL